METMSTAERRVVDDDPCIASASTLYYNTYILSRMYIYNLLPLYMYSRGTRRDRDRVSRSHRLRASRSTHCHHDGRCSYYANCPYIASTYTFLPLPSRTMSAEQYTQIEQDRAPPPVDDEPPSYDDLAAQNGPNSRFALLN